MKEEALQFPIELFPKAFQEIARDCVNLLPVHGVAWRPRCGEDTVNGVCYAASAGTGR